MKYTNKYLTPKQVYKKFKIGSFIRLKSNYHKYELIEKKKYTNIIYKKSTNIIYNFFNALNEYQEIFILKFMSKNGDILYLTSHNFDVVVSYGLYDSMKYGHNKNWDNYIFINEEYELRETKNKYKEYLKSSLKSGVITNSEYFKILENENI